MVDNTNTNHFSDDDINDILQENGVTNSTGNFASTYGTLDALTTTIDEEEPESAEEGGNSDEESSNENSEETSNADNEIIPPNSPTLLMDDATARFSGAEWFNKMQKLKIIIAGLGGIGSNVSYQIARLNPNIITLYDNDRVDRVNMAGQFYRKYDAGRYKTDAMFGMLQNYTICKHIFSITSRFRENTEPADIMICGFDSMDARKVFFNSWKRHILTLKESTRKKCLYIDGRLSFDTLQVFCITGDDEYNQNRYEKEFLFKDSEAEETICSMKQTTYLACMIGSVMTNLLVNFVANLTEPAIPYDVPFFTEYNAPHMLFNYEY